MLGSGDRTRNGSPKNGPKMIKTTKVAPISATTYTDSSSARLRGEGNAVTDEFVVLEELIYT